MCDLFTTFYTQMLHLLDFAINVCVCSVNTVLKMLSIVASYCYIKYQATISADHG